MRAVAGSMRAKVSPERVVGEFADSAGHFDAGRSAADNDERHQLLPLRSRLADAFGRLEGAEHTAANIGRLFDRLQTGAKLFPFGMAEVEVPRAGGDDQAVERHGIRAEQNLLVGQVEAGDFPQNHPAITLLANTLRSGDAMFAGDRPPVATW